MRLAAWIAWFELRQQLRGRVFWIVFAVSCLMVAGAMAIDVLRVGLTEQGSRVGAAAILRTHQVWSLFHLFTAAALVADAVLRDEMGGMAPIVRATPAKAGAYLIGRFGGAFAGLALCFLSVPLSMALAGVALGLGTGPGGAYAFGLFALALPNLFTGAALCFGLATATRSMTGCLIGAAGLLTLYGLGEGAGGAAVALLDPFGLAAVARVTEGWSVGRLDAEWPGLAGVLLANRVSWAGVAVAFVAAGLVGFRRERGVRSRASPSPPLSPRRLTAASPLSPGGEREWGAPPRPRFDAGLFWAQLRARTRLEVGQVVWTPVFAVLLLMGAAQAAANLWPVAGEGTRAVAAELIGTFRLVPTVVALFFAGELYWAERERGMDALIGATPIDPAMIFAPKLAALMAVLAGLALGTATVAAGLELARGSVPDVSGWLAWYVVPKSFDWALVGVLALFLQSIAPNKLAGWGYMVIHLIGSLALNRLGWTDPIYRYGLYPGAPLPPALSGAEGAGMFLLYWATIAGLLAAAACALAGRGAARQASGG